MYTFEDVQELLNEIAGELPADFYRELNGGIILLEQCRPHPQEGGLYVMGEYHRQHVMGRQICLYYGSFMRVYGNAPEHMLREQLHKTLLHEFTHHLESLAGERGLEIKDQVWLAQWRAKRGNASTT